MQLTPTSSEKRRMAKTGETLEQIRSEKKEAARNELDLQAAEKTAKEAAEHAALTAERLAAFERATANLPKFTHKDIFQFSVITTEIEDASYSSYDEGTKWGGVEMRGGDWSTVEIIRYHKTITLFKNGVIVNTKSATERTHKNIIAVMAAMFVEEIGLDIANIFNEQNCFIENKKYQETNRRGGGGGWYTEKTTFTNLKFIGWQVKECNTVGETVFSNEFSAAKEPLIDTDYAITTWHNGGGRGHTKDLNWEWEDKSRS
jgi:hypothetical protein